MPVSYTRLEEEHEAVRKAAGLFDVSHMGEILFEGDGALAAANALLSNDLEGIVDGQAMYAGLLNEEGGFVDDVVVYRENPKRILVCVNAANTAKDFAWMVQRSKVKPRNASLEYAQLALQGPKAAAILGQLCAAPVHALPTYHFLNAPVAGVPCMVARTGYTGEDGFELYASAEVSPKLWTALLEVGHHAGLLPVGLAARDTLRTEMKYALYGNEIDEERNPFEAGLQWIVKLGKASFIGKEALVDAKARGVESRLVGFCTDAPGIPRSGYPIVAEGQHVGKVTSGTMSPSLHKAIGIGYVPSALASEGTHIAIEIRGRQVPATIVKTPFYRRPAA